VNYIAVTLTRRFIRHRFIYFEAVAIEPDSTLHRKCTEVRAQDSSNSPGSSSSGKQAQFLSQSIAIKVSDSIFYITVQ